jgi:hypothetical protein
MADEETKPRPEPLPATTQQSPQLINNPRKVLLGLVDNTELVGLNLRKDFLGFGVLPHTGMQVTT